MNCHFENVQVTKNLQKQILQGSNQARATPSMAYNLYP